MCLRLRRSLSDRALALFMGASAFLLYLRTLAPGVLDGDSGEWQYMANILGVAHSTGYPLYLLLAKLFTFLPFGNAAWRVSLFSAACAAVAVAVIYLLARRLTRSRFASLAAAALFAVAPTLWASAVEAEVYALNTLLLALTFFFAVAWYQDRRPRDLFLMALCFGLALDNHRVSAFAAPGLLLLVILQRKWLNLRLIVVALLLVLAPLLLYSYIPIRGAQLLADQSPANWELYPRAEAFLKGTVSAYYNPSLYGFFNLITGFDNRNKLGFEEASRGDGLLGRVANSGALLLQQLNPLVLLIAIAGLVILWRRDRRLALVLLSIAAGISAISVTLRAESTRFYFSGAYLIADLFFAVGAGVLLDLVHNPFARSDGEKASAGSRASPSARGKAVGGVGVLAAILLLALPIAALVINFPQIDQSGNNAYERYARTVLADNLAPNAVVIAPWEIVTGLRYCQLVEGQRPDLLFVHESPVRPQYEKILTAAHALQRPFYYVQFTPEDKKPGELRTVQAVGLPLTSKPAPAYPTNIRLIDSVRIMGYDLSPDPVRIGDNLRLSIYYEVLAPVEGQFKAGLDWNDIRGEPHGSYEHMPASDYYPTYLWKPGEYFRDVWDIPISPRDSQGLYSPQLAWYHYDPNSGATDYDVPITATLGPIRVGDFATPEIRQRQEERFVNRMTILGFDSPSTDLKPGRNFDFSIFWSTPEALAKSYTISTHLEDESGRVYAVLDHLPWDGMFPTDQWGPGEVVRDRYSIPIPADLPAGQYLISIGVYLQPDRLEPLVSGSRFRAVLEVTLNAGGK